MTKTILTSALILGSVVASQAASIAYDPSGNTTTEFSSYTGSVGLTFTVSTDITVTELGITTNSNGDTLDTSELVTQLYRLDNPGVDNSSTLLGEINFTFGQTATIANTGPYGWDTFMEAPTGGSINLTLGETYVISSYGFGGTENRSYINNPDSVSVATEITHVGSRYGAAAAMPATEDGASIKYAGPTFTYTVTVPEPSSAALLGLGGLALILRRRK